MLRCLRGGDSRGVELRKPPDESRKLDLLPEPPSESTPWDRMRALVLGGTGMIGFHTVLALQRRGADVRVLVRPESTSRNIPHLNAELVEGDLRDPESIRRALEGCDLLFHCAAPYPRTHFHRAGQVEQARSGMAGVLSVARSFMEDDLVDQAAISGPRAWPSLRDLAGRKGLKRIVYVSSLTTIGPPGSPGGLSTEEDRHQTPPGSSPYFHMKEAMEDEALQACRAGLPVVIGNPSLCIDTHDAAPTTGQLLISAARRGVPLYFPGETNVVATRDVGEALVAAADLGRIGERYILGGENMSIREFLTRVSKACGTAPPRLVFPLPLAGTLAWCSEALNLLARRPWPMIPLSTVQMMRHSHPMDSSKARRELGMPATPVDGAIRDALMWLRENGYVDRAG